MACLFRVAKAKVRHNHRYNKSLIAAVRTWVDRGVAFNLIVSVPGLIWSKSYEKTLMPIADKYLLVGEENIMQKVKTQIFFEYTRFNIMNLWFNRKKIDIEMSNGDDPYIDSTDDKNKRVMLMVCVSAETNEEEAKYLLPKKIPSNTENITVVEAKRGEDNLRENALSYLKKYPMMSKLITSSKYQIVLSPATSSLYQNKQLDDSSRQCVYVIYALFMSAVLQKFIRK
ncbi:uncharacterized protein [Mytilus edulis]|uniref:uncharacterized protein n=1 Tax=Mytilus edulis TaxID=6550 RepID=UPI0039EE252D